MKKTALLLTLVLIVGLLSACGSANNTSSTTDPTATPTTAQPTDSPTPVPPTDTPTPSPTPTPDPNCYFSSDFDSAPEGLILKEIDAEKLATIEENYEFTYLLFNQIGAAYADFGQGRGVNGTNCLVATGRNGLWHGISLDVDPKWYGKGFIVSFDAKSESMKDGVTDMNISFTTQFQYIKEDGTASGTVYPALNRVTGVSSNGEWVHCEGTVFLPSDISGTSARLYFECSTGKGKEDILIDNLTMIATDGVGNYEEFLAYWEAHQPEAEE